MMVLQLHVAVCCRLLQRVVVRRRNKYTIEMIVPLPAAACCSVLQRVAACCSALQRVAACCSVLQRVAASCSELQRGLVRCSSRWKIVMVMQPPRVANCQGGHQHIIKIFAHRSDAKHARNRRNIYKDNQVIHNENDKESRMKITRDQNRKYSVSKTHRMP